MLAYRDCFVIIWWKIQLLGNVIIISLGMRILRVADGGGGDPQLGGNIGSRGNYIICVTRNRN